MFEFPKDFFWGAATSSHQVEGNNINNDWWDWEKRTGRQESSGEACRHYELYKADFDLARQLGHNAHRFSLEWSRVEPRKHIFSSEEIKHYIEVVDCLKKNGLEPIVTLHHFTNPLWFSGLGGWLDNRCCDYFLEYVRKIVSCLCEKVNFWVTVNEPLVYIYYSYILGDWPPQEKSFAKAKTATKNLLRAHVGSYRVIKDIYKKKNLSLPMVSIAKNVQAFEPCLWDEPSGRKGLFPALSHQRNKFAAYLRNRAYNFSFVDKLIRQKSLDFIGINYYSRNLADVGSWRVNDLLLDTCKDNHSKLKKNSIGWDIYPEGLYRLLIRFSRYKLPIFILENGVCTLDDQLRWDFIRQHLISVHRAIDKGVRVLGYIYWSLIDNYEWDKGFAPRFGLVEVDYTNYRRTPRDSANKFAQVCRTNKLD